MTDAELASTVRARARRARSATVVFLAFSNSYTSISEIETAVTS